MLIENIELIKQNSSSLDIYIQDKTKRRKPVLIVPGGAYIKHTVSEMEPVAFSFMAEGFQAFVLRYALNSKWPAPLNDFVKAIDYIEDNAVEFNIDIKELAVCSFSAGGHLSLMGSQVCKDRIRALILGYPVVNKETLQMLNLDYPSAIKTDIPPCFIFHTRNDELVSIDNTISLLNYLNKNSISYECHIYSYGNHGFGLGNKEGLSPNVYNWFKDCLNWLNDQNFRRKINDDSNYYLSVDCTLGRLKQNRYAKELILKKTGIDISEGYKDMKLSSLLHYMKIDRNEELNNLLNRIRND